MRPMLARLLSQWETQILRPVLVAVLTSSVLVAGSLLFKPIRHFLLPPDELEDYPLYCTAEPYVRPENSARMLGVDFFIINLTGNEKTREELAEFLKARSPDVTRPMSPDIHLRYTRSMGRIDRAYLDPEFNADKGELEIRTGNDSVQIVSRFLEPRALMKVSIVIAGVPTVAAVTRATPGAVPLTYEEYQRGCYSR